MHKVGIKWQQTETDKKRPGQEINNEVLKHQLRQKTLFSKAELDEIFRDETDIDVDKVLSESMYIEVDGTRYQVTCGPEPCFL